MRFAYADPPYPGLEFFYKDDPNCAPVNFPLLISYLNEFDGWAMSLHSPALKLLLPLCPSDTRILAWVKPFCSFKPGVNPAYAWEPVLSRGGRPRGKLKPTVRDWVASNITLKKGLVGVKPVSFCFWIFEFLGMEPDDEFLDIFPGSGAVGLAHTAWKNQLWFQRENLEERQQSLLIDTPKENAV